MNWLQAVILILCVLNLGLLLALVGILKRSKLIPPPQPIQSTNPPAGGPPKADQSVILMTDDRDSRILDGDEG